MRNATAGALLAKDFNRRTALTLASAAALVATLPAWPRGLSPQFRKLSHDLEEAMLAYRQAGAQAERVMAQLTAEFHRRSPWQDLAEHPTLAAFAEAGDRARLAAERLFSTPAVTAADEDAVLVTLDLYRDTLRLCLFTARVARDLFLPMRHQGGLVALYAEQREEILSAPTEEFVKFGMPWFLQDLRNQRSPAVETLLRGAG